MFGTKDEKGEICSILYEKQSYKFIFHFTNILKFLIQNNFCAIRLDKLETIL